MAQLDWRPMQVMDTSNYLDAIARAQANTVKGVEGIGNAFKGYYDGLKDQNTNQMLSILNQAKDQNGLVDAQQQIAALQQRFGNGYDLDKVRTAVDERPNVLLQRQTNQMEFDQKRAALDAIPQRNAMFMKLAEQYGVSPETLASASGIDGVDITGDLNSFTNFARQDASNARQAFVQNRDYNLRAEGQTFDQNLATQKFNLEQQQAAIQTAATLYGLRDPESEVIDEFGQTVQSGGGYSGIGEAMGYTARLFNRESGMNPNAVNPGKGQTASGLGQFTNESFLGYVKQTMPDFARGKTDDELMRYKNDPKIQTILTNAYAEDNVKLYAKHGITNPTNGQVALGHFLDGKNAVKLIKANPNTPVSQLLSSKQINANPSVLKGKTAGQVLNAMEQSMGGGRYVKEGSGGSVGGINTPTSSGKGISRAELFKVKDSYDSAKVQWNMKRAGGDPVLDPTRFDELKVKGDRSFYKTDNYQILDIMRKNPTAQQLPTASLQKVLNKATQYREDKKFGQIIDSDRLEASVNSYIAAEAKHYKATRQQQDAANNPLNSAVAELQQAYRKAGVNLSKANAIKLLDEEHYNMYYAKNQVQKAQPKPQPVPSKPIVKSNSNAKATSSDASAQATAKARALAKQVEANTAKRNKDKGIVPRKPKPVVKDTRISDVANTLFNPKPMKVPINQEWLKKQKKS